MERLEAEHWPCGSLDEAMILFDDIIEIYVTSTRQDRAVGFFLTCVLAAINGENFTTHRFKVA